MSAVMQQQFRTVDSLQAHAINQRIYGDEALPDEFVSSIKARGILEPIQIKSDGTIISGHRRWQAAKQIGLDAVPVTICDYTSDLDERLALIEFNRQREKTFTQKMNEAEELEAIEKERAKARKAATQLAGKDKEGKHVTASVTAKLPEPNKGETREKVAKQTGIGSARTYDTAKKLWTKAKEGDEVAAKLVEAVDSGKESISGAYKKLEKKERAEHREKVKAIELPPAQPVEVEAIEAGWHRLGDQYLYCGSNLDQEFLAKLPRAQFAFADPPYNAGVDEWDSGFNWEQDYLEEFAEVVAVTPGGWNAAEFYRQTRMTYQWEMACWIRNGMTHGRCGYANWIKASIFGKKPKIQQDFFDITIKTSETEDTSHRGRKPYPFMGYMIDIFSKPGQVLIDPFAGSGTTLLMCHRMNRKSYNAELSAEYCGQIIERAKALGADYERL